MDDGFKLGVEVGHGKPDGTVKVTVDALHEDSPAILYSQSSCMVSNAMSLVLIDKML